MNYDLIIRPDAESDVADARSWYEEQRAGLGDDFVLCVEEALERIRRAPEVNAVSYKRIRRALVHRFPYVIYYRA